MSSSDPLVPAELLAAAARGPRWASWVASLPRVVAELLDAWELVPDGAPMHGHAAVVVPVRGVAVGAAAGAAGGLAAMALKVGFVDEESEHEALALQRWGGRGAVRLARADPRRRAMLLERLPGPDLTDTWDVEACEVVGGLYARLHVPAPPQLRVLPSYVERAGSALAALPRSAPVPRRLVEQAVSLGRELCADPVATGTMIHTDLHYANVLAGTREPWLAIDPKPVSGDPHYEPAPMLWNRWDEMVASGDVRDAVRRRFHTLVDTARLDESRARDWVVVRMLHNASWELRDAERLDRGPEAGWVTRCITIAKAVQD